MDRIYSLSEEEKEVSLRNANDVRALRDNRGFKILLAHLEEDAHQAIHTLKSVDPEKPADIRKFQNVIWRYEELINKVESVINLGDAILETTQMTEGDDYV